MEAVWRNWEDGDIMQKIENVVRIWNGGKKMYLVM